MCAFLCVTIRAPAADWTATLGAERTRGDFGIGAQTTIDYVPFSLQARRHPWSLKVSASHLDLTTDTAPSSGARTQTSAAGAGDTLITARYALDTAPRWATWVDLAVQVKVPTADERDRLGTGETDTTLKLDLYVRRGAWTPFFTLGYKAVGDVPGLLLQDQWLVTLGIQRGWRPAITTGLLVDYREPSSAGASEALEAVPYLNWRISRSYGLMVYGIAGLADGSPDEGLGLQNSFHW